MIRNQIILSQRTKIEDHKIIEGKISNRKIDPKLEEESQKIWDDLLKSCHSKGIFPWNGTYYRLDNLEEIRSGSKILKLSTVQFSTIQGYKALSRKYDLDESRYTNHISTLALIKTADNYYVFGKRGKSINSHKIDFIGGGLLKSEREIFTGSDIESNQFIEMKEEANIDREDVEISHLVGILLSEEMNVLFVFNINLKIFSSDLQEKFKEREDKKEMKDLIFVKESELKTFLKQQESYRPLVLQLDI